MTNSKEWLRQKPIEMEPLKKWGFRETGCGLYEAMTDGARFGGNASTIIQMLIGIVKKYEKASGAKLDTVEGCDFPHRCECHRCKVVVIEVFDPTPPAWKELWDECQTYKPWSEDWWDCLLKCDIAYTYIK